MSSAKAKSARTPAPKWAAGGNARGKARREAVKQLNELAEEVSLKPMVLKAPLQKLLRGMPRRLARCKANRYGRCGK